jgi:hypothetical protein
MAILKNTTFTGTSALVLPRGTTAQRPATPVDGDIRFNTDLGITEYYYKGFWADTRTNQGAFRKDGAVLILDATLPESYPGTGTVWTDISGTGNNFTVNASAYRTAGDTSTKPGYMDFNGSYGCAATASGSDVPRLPGAGGGCTYICVTRVLQSSSAWRTLTRGETSGADHHIIIESGGWRIGMYDNINGSGFNTTSFSQQSLPSYRTRPASPTSDGGRSWEVLAWTWSNEDNPSYRFFVNGVSYGTISAANARYKCSFRTLGAYLASSPSQFWGDIKFFAAYDRRLGLDEILFNTHSLRYRFGI